MSGACFEPFKKQVEEQLASLSTVGSAVTTVADVTYKLIHHNVHGRGLNIMSDFQFLSLNSLKMNYIRALIYLNFFFFPTGR